MSRNNLKQTFTQKTKITSIFHYILDAGLIFLGIWGILLGAFVFFIIGLILPIIGGINSVSKICGSKKKYGGGFRWYDIFLPWTWIIYGLKFILSVEGDILSDLTTSVSHNNNKPDCGGFITSILLSIAAFFTSLNIFTPVLGPLQSLYFIWKVAITPIFNSQPGYYKGILQKYKHIIFVLFLASLLSSAWASLNTLTATGITIGAVISAISWIYSTYG